MHLPRSCLTLCMLMGCLVPVSKCCCREGFLSSPVPVKTHATRTASQSLEVIIYGTISAIRSVYGFTPCGIPVPISARPGFLSGAGTGLSRSPPPRKRSATTQTTHTALRRATCCALCSRLRPQLHRWKAASEAPQRGRGCEMRFGYSQLELAALPEVEGDAQKNDILTGRVSPKLALDATKEAGS